MISLVAVAMNNIMINIQLNHAISNFYILNTIDMSKRVESPNMYVICLQYVTPSSILRVLLGPIEFEIMRIDWINVITLLFLILIASIPSSTKNEHLT